MIGNKDVDRIILNKLDDKELLKACSIDTWEKVCDDSFLKRRLLEKYPQIEHYKEEKETWKHFFLRAVRYIALIKEENNFGYEYSFGDFKKQYNLIKEYNRYNYNKNMHSLLLDSSKEGELALVMWSLKNGANIHVQDDLAFRWASIFGHLDVAKYLVEKGAYISADDDFALIFTAKHGHLDVVKFLVEQGANIHARNNEALRWASYYGYLEIVKYLVEQGANINARRNEALRRASEKGHLEVVKYLIEQGADLHALNDEDLRKVGEKGHSEVVNYLKSKM